MNGALEQRVYKPAEVIAFRKTNERFGGLSNMAPGFPIVVNHVRFWTSEALYQCCRFPNEPDVQRIIASQRSPMTAKMKSKKYRERTRSDWDSIKVRTMRWSLRVKLVQNRDTFAPLLLSTGEKPIVEESAKDQFWGAKVQDRESLAGINVLGRLLMELREQMRTSTSIFTEQPVEPPAIPNFLLFGEPVGIVTSKPEGGTVINYPDREEPSRVRISGELSQDDWNSLMRILAAAQLSAEKAILNIELKVPSGTSDDSQIKQLAEIARKFGMRFKAW